MSSARRLPFIGALAVIATGCIKENEIPVPAVVQPQQGELAPEDVTRAYSEIEMLRRDPSPENEKKLIALASHADFLLRIRAVRALGDPGYSSRHDAENVLYRALSDSHWIVRATAVKAVGRSGTARACRELLNRKHQEPNHKVREQIEKALSEIRSSIQC